jgi:hypothetical protein
MYYKEKWINGKLMFKLSPKENWREFTVKMYANRIIEREEQILSLTYDLKKLEGKLCKI